VSRYQKGKTNLDFTEATDSKWQRHQLGRMQVCTSLQTDNHVSTPTVSFLQARCPSCRPTNSVKALKAWQQLHSHVIHGSLDPHKYAPKWHLDTSLPNIESMQCTTPAAMHPNNYTRLTALCPVLPG